MEEKRLAKRNKFWASYEKLELMGQVKQYLVNYSSEQINIKRANLSSNQQIAKSKLNYIFLEFTTTERIFISSHIKKLFNY